MIFSPLALIVDGEEIENVEVNDPAIDIYDYYEVIGIRATYWDGEDYIEISLKPTISDYYTEAKATQIRGSYETGFICKK